MKDTITIPLLMEILYLGFVGFLSGLILVWDAMEKPTRPVLYGVALIFAGILMTMSVNVPSFPLMVFKLKPYFILAMGMLFGFFYNRIKDRESKEKRSVSMVLMTYLFMLMVLIVASILFFMTGVLISYFTYGLDSLE